VVKEQSKTGEDHLADNNGRPTLTTQSATGGGASNTKEASNPPVSHARDEASDTVVVGCKLPNGIVLQNWKMVETTEPSQQGYKKINMAVRDGEPVRLRGAAVPFGKMPLHAITSGYALTYGVKRDFWEHWRESNKDSDLLKNNIVFACGDEQRARDYARDHEKVVTGLEPVDPTKPPREMARTIAMAEEQIANPTSPGAHVR
jgi:hypothetical protein